MNKESKADWRAWKAFCNNLLLTKWSVCHPISRNSRILQEQIARLFMVHETLDLKPLSHTMLACVHRPSHQGQVIDEEDAVATFQHLDRVLEFTSSPSACFSLHSCCAGANRMTKQLFGTRRLRRCCLRGMTLFLISYASLFAVFVIDGKVDIILHVQPYPRLPLATGTSGPSLPSKPSVSLATSTSRLKGPSLPSESSLLPEETSDSQGIILTSYLTYKQDPRHAARGRPFNPHPGFEQIYQFYTTVMFYKLRAIIFHDGSFTEDFVQKYERKPFIQFMKVDPPVPHDQVDADTIVVNDYRYHVMHEFMNNDKNQTHIKGVEWFLITDMDVFFNRDPFVKLFTYSIRYNQTLFGSYDGGIWKDTVVRLQYKLFRKCYGVKFVRSLTEEQLGIRNGNCGLWGGKRDKVQCILQCMSQQVLSPTLRRVNGGTLCDMAVHDYCVQIDPNKCLSPDKHELRWGPDSGGEGNELFGPPYARRHESCLWDWTVVHNRCDTPWKPPICFSKEVNEGKMTLKRYHQIGHQGRLCKLDHSDMPLPNNLTEAQ